MQVHCNQARYCEVRCDRVRRDFGIEFESSLRCLREGDGCWTLPISTARERVECRRVYVHFRIERCVQLDPTLLPSGGRRGPVSSGRSLSGRGFREHGPRYEYERPYGTSLPRPIADANTQGYVGVVAQRLPLALSGGYHSLLGDGVL
jgi:hypothetical protein